ncbi:MAG: ATP-binding cassette domain-containing protein [Pseudomonadota bacterium]
MAINPKTIHSAKGYLFDARDLVVGFGDKIILDGVSVGLKRSEILGVVGPSGCGKSVLLRTLIGLVPRMSGQIRYFGRDIDRVAERDRRKIEKRWGVLFQHGALFSSLTVKENVQVPMREHLNISQKLMDELAELTISMVGLNPDAGAKYPSELSGGMIKRAALARALALNPDILFLDEPTSGLDPVSAANFDELMLNLQQTLGLSVFMVTHDLDSIFRTCSRLVILKDRKVLVDGELDTVLAFEDDWVQSYFGGKQARVEYTEDRDPGAIGAPT